MTEHRNNSERIAVIGLGYVGLPIAVSMARKFDEVIGFDINQERVKELNQQIDRTGEVARKDLDISSLKITRNQEDLNGASIFIVTVPTPIDKDNKPDLGPLLNATRSVGQVITKGAVVVYESTVYPNVTEDICGPILEEESGLTVGIDFNLAYSPERINPGDPEHSFEKIVKVVSADSEETLERVANVYGAVITAGIHRASSIKVAEAAKVIENIQRDLNIALMNELAMIFDRLNISTKEVLEAAGTKWNFLHFTPGLVGGHCIGVDPYYLTTRAEQVGYHPQVILAGRRVNERMGIYVAQKCVKLLSKQGKAQGARVGVLGLTFKENISDIRNTRVASLIGELKEFGVMPLVHDPLADPAEVKEEYGIELTRWEDMHDLDSIILAVAHDQYLSDSATHLYSLLKKGGIIIDVKATIPREKIPEEYTYWCL